MSTRDHPDWWRPMGGQNSQDSILERRSLVWNDDGIEDGTVPDDFFEAATIRGKFFTRGCRGMIEQIQLYCIGDAVDEITIRYSPFPGIGPFGEVTITPAAAWAWQDFNVEEMWNYDSLFIWVQVCGFDVDWAYDEIEPYDGHIYTGVGPAWRDLAIRPFFRVVYTGETPGDVPVSGIVNVIEIPTVGTRIVNAESVEVAHNINVGICEIEGAGTLLEAELTFATSIVPTAGAPPAGIIYRANITVDGALAYMINNRQLTQSMVATFGRNSIGEFYQGTVAEPAWDETNLHLRLPIKFKRSIILHAFQTTGGPVDVDGVLHVNLLE